MRRLVLALVFAAVAAGIVAAGARAAPTATCSPLACGTWQPGPVTLTWTDADPLGTPAVCPTTVTAESPGVSGTVVPCNDQSGLPAGDGTVTVFIDNTGPTLAPAPDHPPDANGWYNSPVTLLLNGTDPLSGLASCQAPVYSGPDKTNASLTGTCTDNAGNASAAGSISFDYDATAPTVTGAAADRSPDHNGWYNHPVTFNFRGTDKLSGIAGCSSVTYSGPVDSTATVRGTCTDQAGNTDSGTETFK
jgi:hypothetical protein